MEGTSPTNTDELIKELVYVGPHKASSHLFEMVKEGKVTKEQFHSCLSEVIFLVLEEIAEETEETMMMQRLLSNMKVATC